MTALTKTAKVVEDLVDYDGPQLLLLETNRNRPMFATAVRRQNMDEPFFGCETTDKIYDQYFDGTADLHFAFVRAIGKRYYFFDFAAAENDTVNLQKANNDEAENPAYWPQVGFFSRSHTNQFKQIERSGTTKIYKIDGKWRANDFSHFHGKMSDLYALFGVLERLEGAFRNTERGFIRKTIQDRFWQGGGSYLGFYDSLMTRNMQLKLIPLDVDKIKYASPGEISLRGSKKALSDISDIIDVFDEKWDELLSDYRNIHRALKKDNLLSASPTTEFSSPAMRNFIKKVTKEFAEKMRIEQAEQLYEACDRNVLVYTKVILSIYRRANEVYLFHAEGRIQRPD
jgi:hypothetical protein